MKILFIVIDGLPDDKIPQLGNKTPLEAANRQNLDRFAKNGISGYFQPLFLGKLPDSEEVHFSLFGYDPRKYLPGRGILEALGTDTKLLPEDIALRANFATIDEAGKIIDRRSGRIKQEDSQELLKAIDNLEIKEVKFLAKPIWSHRFCIIIRGKNLSENISDTDDKSLIGKKPKKVFASKKSKQAEFTTNILNLFLEKANDILKDHPLNKKRLAQGLLPANFILTRGAGRLKKIESFQKKWGLKACCLSYGALYRGIAKYLGMDILQENNGQTKLVLSSAYIKNKFLAVKKALKNYDFVFCHIKGADTLAEDGNYLGKKKFIETIDTNLKILDNLKSVLLVITSDHGTSSLKKDHIVCPVPFLIYPLLDQKNNVAGFTGFTGFTEKACRQGKEIKNMEMLPLILKTAKENNKP